ncbi:MAG TPA: hypothetical protein VGU23_00495 [Acidobacteriaceae bacterium]|nr:hypothetical protein [Acidobacteriaceae bacterium]
MAKLTIVFGVLLIALGAWGFFATGSVHPTALIPAYFGLALGWLGGLALVKPAQRAVFMHIAVTLGLLGFLGTAPALVDAVRMLRGVVFPHPMAVEEKAAMSGICLVFVGLCVRSFMAARRRRELDASA